MTTTQNEPQTAFKPYMILTKSGNIYRAINDGETKSGEKCIKVRKRYYRGMRGNNGVDYGFESPIWIKAEIVAQTWSVKYKFPIGYVEKE